MFPRSEQFHSSIGYRLVKMTTTSLSLPFFSNLAYKGVIAEFLKGDNFLKSILTFSLSLKLIITDSLQLTL